MLSNRSSTDGLSETEEAPSRENGDTDAPPHDSSVPDTPDSHEVPTAKRARNFLRRRDPLAWAVGSTAFLLGLAFIAVNLSYNAGNFIPPLDDAYIHLQYASQIGEGHFLRYNTGDPISTGASSLLYVLVLGGFYALGIQGSAFLPFAMGFGLLCFALAAVCVYRIGCRIANRIVGTLAGFLVALNGALLWGSVSGMEIGFVALLLTATLLSFTVELPRSRFLLTPLVAVPASLARPEAFIFCAVLCVTMAWLTLRARPRATLPRVLGRLSLLVLPFLAYGGQMLLYWITTGTTSANGMQAKSLLYAPILYITNLVDETLTHFNGFMLVFLGINTYDYVFPGTLLVAILGTVYLVRSKPEWRPMGLATAAGFLLVMLAISTMSIANVHHLRYVQPFMPILLLLAAVGIYALADLLSNRRARLLTLSSGCVVALLFTVIQTPAWSIRLGQQSAGIRDQQVTISNWMKGHLPPGSVIAVNDVGAAAYFSDHYIIDLVGLTTNKLTEARRNGPGSLYEALRELPEQRRPDYFSVFDNWGVYALKAGMFAEQPLIKFQLKSPVFSHRGPGFGSACQAARYCNEVVIFKADWSDVGTGDLPAEINPAGEIRDYVNVADLGSEDAHSYRVVPAHHGFQPGTSLESVTYPDGDVVDSGRHVIGGEVMTVHDLTPGESVTITSRIDAEEPLPNKPTGSRAVDVSVNGRFVGTWQFERTDKGWAESTFTIPGEFVTDSTLTVEFGPRQKFLGPYPDYVSYGYWFSQ